MESPWRLAPSELWPGPCLPCRLHSCSLTPYPIRSPQFLSSRVVQAPGILPPQTPQSWPGPGRPARPHAPSCSGGGTVCRISSSWCRVEVPGNRGFPRSISPRMQPRLHMSTPGVYLAGVAAEASRGGRAPGREGAGWPRAGKGWEGPGRQGGGVTSWRPAAPPGRGTSAWPRTRSAPGPRAPRGGRPGSAPGRSRRASPGSSRPAARWTAAGEAAQGMEAGAVHTVGGQWAR